MRCNYITLSTFQTPLTPEVTSECIYNYMLYKIQPTGPAHRLELHSKSGTTKGKEKSATQLKMQIAATLTISFHRWQPHKFNVILRTTTTYPGHVR